MLKNFIKDKIAYITSLLAACCFLFFAFGCEPKTSSLIDSGTQVTRAQLNNELQTLVQSHKWRLEDLDRQDTLRNVILQQSIIVAESGSVNPFAIVTSLMAILGLGAGVDDVRLRKKIKKGTGVDAPVD